MTDLVGKVCAVCGRVLDFHHEHEAWEHVISDQPADHPAVPVDRSEVPGIGRCDFCQADHPAWLLPARDFHMPYSRDHRSIGGWSACDDCADLLRKDAWNLLKVRARASYETKHGPMSKAEVFALGIMYRELRRNVTGAVRPVES